MTIMSDELKKALGIIEGDKSEKPQEYIDEEGEVHYPVATVSEQPSTSTDIEPYVPNHVPTSVPEVDDNTDIREDYIKSRDLTYNLIDMTGAAITGALNVALQSQHPKAYSVFNELASTMRFLAKDLIELQETYKNITKEKEAKAKIVATQNNTIITHAANASLSDILRALEDNATPSSNIIDVDSKEIDNE